MRRAELAELIANGENSGVEHDVASERLSPLVSHASCHRYTLRPVAGSTLYDLDRRRLVSYFRDIRQQGFPHEEDDESWCQLLTNTGFMAAGHDQVMATAGALLLFGLRPNRFLPQAGITAVAYPGTEKDYAAKARSLLRGPIIELRSAAGTTVEIGVIEQALDFVRRNTNIEAWIDHGGRRQERWDYPLDAVRETLVNAIAHRDYTITVTDVELSIYADRLEVISPGRLPNTVTVAKMRTGYRASRNELIKEVLRDYRYVEATGLGVPRKIIRGMKEHNGTEPDLIEEEDRFLVRLWKERRES